MKPASAIIVGGGIGGMTTALALARTGWRVRLYERAPAFSEIGAGIMLTPNATRVLGYLGLAAALDECAMRPPASIYRRFDDAEIVGDSPLGPAIEATYGSPYFHIHRSDLLDLLTAAVESQGRVQNSSRIMKRSAALRKTVGSPWSLPAARRLRTAW